MSRQTVGHMCKQKVFQTKCLTIEGGTDGSSRNVGNYKSTLFITSGERRYLVDSRSVVARRFRLADEGNGQLRWTASVCYRRAVGLHCVLQWLDLSYTNRWWQTNATAICQRLKITGASDFLPVESSHLLCKSGRQATLFFLTFTVTQYESD